MRIVSRVFAAGLITVGLALLPPAAAANAGTTYTVIWINSESATSTFTYSCSAGAQTYYGENVDQVSNGCSDRVWIHEDTNGDGTPYCINPGALAYAFSTTVDFTQVEPSGSSTSPCDAGAELEAEWIGEPGGTYQSYPCSDGYATSYGGEEPLVAWVDNTCNTRVWVHNPSGVALACVSPYSTFTTSAVQFGDSPVEIQISGNQAPCSAG
jgi:hypothetical protein